MLVLGDKRLTISDSPHSLANLNSLTTPSWGDTNYFVQTQKLWNSHGFAGINGKCAGLGCNVGMNGLTFDGSGLFGTGLFTGDVTEWGIPEVLLSMVGAYMVYASVFQAKQTKYRLEMTAGRRRKKRAASLREKAKKLEEKTTGLF